jgi:hypothetical protein
MTILAILELCGVAADVIAQIAAIVNVEDDLSAEQIAAIKARMDQAEQDWADA